MANMEKLGYAFLKFTSTNAGKAALATAGEAVGEIVLTGLSAAGSLAVAAAPVAIPLAAVYGLYKFFKR